jgi:hypothetical protein
MLELEPVELAEFEVIMAGVESEYALYLPVFVSSASSSSSSSGSSSSSPQSITSSFAGTGAGYV